MKAVVCVPWRGGEAQREANWAATLPFLEGLGYRIYTGDSQGAWSRAGACNAAAAAAGAWDVAIFADADTIPERVVIRRAVDIARRREGAVRPHDHLWRLTRVGSRMLLRRGIERFSPSLASGTFPGGGLLVVSRRAFEAVGGFDERFVGWGHEDSALGIALVRHASWERIPGNAYHLWHPPASTRTPEYRRNRMLLRQLRAERENHHAISAASQRLGFDVGAVL